MYSTIIYLTPRPPPTFFSPSAIVLVIVLYACKNITCTWRSCSPCQSSTQLRGVQDRFSQPQIPWAWNNINVHLSCTQSTSWALTRYILTLIRYSILHTHVEHSPTKTVYVKLKYYILHKIMPKPRFYAEANDHQHLFSCWSCHPWV